MHADPEFAAHHARRCREYFRANQAELQRRSLAKRRGVVVPPELEGDWLMLKRKKLTNQEAAGALGLKWSRPRRKRKARRGPTGS